MSDNELDEILKEVKARSAQDGGEDDKKEENINLSESEQPPQNTPQPQESEDEKPSAEEEAKAAEDETAENPADENEAPQEDGNAPEAEEKTPDEGGIHIAQAEPEVFEAPPEQKLESRRQGKKKKKKNKSKTAIIIICVLIVLALAAAGILYAKGFFGKKDTAVTTTSPQNTTAAPVVIDKNTANPLTGEYGYNKNAIGKRPVAVVVENEYSTEAVRPQWGIADADMIMEGETEFSTRMLFFWADMNQIPDEVGPTRSARPPFIHFSQLWDSIFIHAGLSRSKDNYEGADTVFENEHIDHINLLSFEENGTYFGRDNQRNTAVEHTGYLNGKNAVKLIQKSNISTDLNEAKFTEFEFNDEDEPAGEDPGDTATFKWSDRCPKEGVFTYNSSKGVYTTTDFDSKYGESKLEVKTLIYLLDETEYVVKNNYKGSGNSETYCNYALSGGKGKIVSMGKSTDITWSKENGKLVLKTSDGEDVKLNRGKIYIGYGSSNHGGSISVE